MALSRSARRMPGRKGRERTLGFCRRNQLSALLPARRSADGPGLLLGYADGLWPSFA